MGVMGYIPYYRVMQDLSHQPYSERRPRPDAEKSNPELPILSSKPFINLKYIFLNSLIETLIDPFKEP